MVLESIMPLKIALKKPVEMLPIAFLYATLGIYIALWIFPNYASLTSVFFTVLAAVPLMVNLIKYEEKSVFNKEVQKFEYHHRKAVPFFIFMFVGFVLAFSIWFVVFPQKLVSSLFSVQLNTIIQINNAVSGQFAGSYFVAIILNNIKVLIFSILFSFIYGAGAIFILTWNASVVAVAIGSTIRKFISAYASATGLTLVGAYFGAFSIGLLRYMTHGIAEILGYFVGGLAGGMISVAMLKHEFMDRNFKKVMFDAFNLVLVSIGILIMAALIETLVSPLIPI